MKFNCPLSLSALLLVLSAEHFSLFAQDNVTIPRSRLEELEKKEAELDKLKGDLKKTKGENQELKKQHKEDVGRIPAAPPQQPVVAHVSPPIDTLPPLKPGEPVDAMDLANYYRADPAAADQRFRKKKVQVKGEIASFEKTMFIRDYKIALKTADRDTRVLCNIYPPEKYKAVFTVKTGSELVGVLANDTRVPIARVGDTVLVEGVCEGMSGSVIKLSGCAIKEIR